jgi:hypothetical protein
MTKRVQDIDANSRQAPDKKGRRPYKKPELVTYGKLAEVTAGVGGSNADPGHTAPTKKGGG